MKRADCLILKYVDERSYIEKIATFADNYYTIEKVLLECNECIKSLNDVNKNKN